MQQALSIDARNNGSSGPPSGARKRIRFTAGVAMAALLMTPTVPAQAQLDQGIDTAAKLAPNFGEISKSITNIDALQASKSLRAFKSITDAAGKMAPYLNILSVLVGFASLGEDTDRDIMLKEFKLTNAKIDGLSTQLESAINRINVGGDINNQRETVRKNFDTLTSAQNDLNGYLRMNAANADAVKIFERKSIDFGEIATTAANRCTGDFLDQVATYYTGNLDRISEVGVYLMRNIRMAGELETKYYVLKTNLNNTNRLSSDAIDAKVAEFMMDYDTHAANCSASLSAILAKYSDPLEMMNSAEKFLEDKLATQSSARAIVTTLQTQFPYLNWVAVKYEGLAGSDNHYGVAASRMRMFLPTAKRPWNAVVGYYEKDAVFAAQGFQHGDCQKAFNNLANGISTPQQFGRKPINVAVWQWGTSMGNAADWFKQQCNNPPLAGMWVMNSRKPSTTIQTYRTADFASSDPALANSLAAGAARTLASLSAAVTASQKGAMFSNGKMAAYLIMPEPVPAGTKAVEVPVKAQSLVNVATGSAADVGHLATFLLPGLRNIPHTVMVNDPLPGVPYYRFLYPTALGGALHVQNNNLVVGTVAANSTSAMWSFEPVNGAAGQYRICSRAAMGCLYMQNGRIAIGDASMNGANARWRLQ